SRPQATEPTPGPRHRARTPRPISPPPKVNDENPRTPCFHYALVSYSDGADPGKVTEEFMNSAEFRADVEGLDPSTIIDVTSTLPTPSGSPLLSTKTL